MPVMMHHRQMQPHQHTLQKGDRERRERGRKERKTKAEKEKIS